MSNAIWIVWYSAAAFLVKIGSRDPKKILAPHCNGVGYQSLMVDRMSFYGIRESLDIGIGYGW